MIVTGLSLLLLYLGATGFGWVLYEAHPPGALEPLVKLLRMPEGTLLYDSDMRHMYAFYPDDTD